TLTHPVGKYHVYNNKAINLLAGIIEKAAGMRMDEWMEKELFRPLGITDTYWRKDSAGNPYCMAFLEIRPRDLAKIGQLLLQNGQWEGRQLISRAFIEEAMRPAAPFLPNYGLLWELYTDTFEFVVDETQLQALKAANVHPDFLARARQIEGRYDGYRPYYGKVREVFGDSWREAFQRHLWPTGLHLGRKETGGQWAFAGLGYLGQHLIVWPEAELVAVRLIAQYDGYDWNTDELTDFPELVRALVEGPGR
ncbi:MAG: serine hydrolase, partial [Phaeodactylibacter sp.]|nr:serine hydrolase [Phaeodactylibacter sp.]